MLHEDLPHGVREASIMRRVICRVQCSYSAIYPPRESGMRLIAPHLEGDVVCEEEI